MTALEHIRSKGFEAEQVATQGANAVLRIKTSDKDGKPQGSTYAKFPANDGVAAADVWMKDRYP